MKKYNKTHKFLKKKALKHFLKDKILYKIIQKTKKKQIMQIILQKKV